MSRRLVEAIDAAATVAFEDGSPNEGHALVEMRDRLREKMATPLPTGEVRDAVLYLGRFTLTELHEHLGRSRAAVKARLEELIEKGICRDTHGFQYHDGPGRPAPIFEYVDVERRKVNREKRKPPHEEIDTKKISSPTPFGHGKKKLPARKLTPDADLRTIIIEARKHGVVVDKSGNNHIVFLLPSGETLFSASTPSDHRSIPNFRQQLRRAGIPV